MAAGAQQPSCSVTPVATDADFTHALASLPASALAVIYFHASWAEPCKQMSTILDTLASTYEASSPARIAFLSLDAEEVAEVSERYDVTQVPLVVLQKGGQVVASVTGTDAGKVRRAVEQHAGPANGTNGGGGSGAGASSLLPPVQKVVKQQPTAAVPAAAVEPSAPSHIPGSSQSAEVSNGATSTEELNRRLSELVKAAPVMLFMKGTPSTPQCGFSRQTVGILREKGVRYGFFNILADDEVRQGLKEFSEWPTFPQLYVDGELVGGLDIVKEEFENNADFLKEYSVHT